ncbi:SEC-C motif-containing protein [Methylorubrum aminovorans]
MDADLIERLSVAEHMPKDALRQAVTEPEAIAEAVLGVLATAAEDPDAPSEHEANLLFWGLHALAAARDPRVYAPLMRLLHQDGEAVEALLGDATTITTARIIASVFDGDAGPLHALILDSAADGFIRNEAFTALAYLTRQGRLPLEDARALLLRFDAAQAAVEGDMAWVGWEEAIAYLGLTDLAPRSQAARRDGRLTDEFSDAAWFRKALRQASAEPPDLSEFGDRYGTLDDPVEALAWTEESYGQPVTNPFKDVGRNDPCPCGSGKKFKKCCLNAAEASAPPVRLPGLS